MFQPPTRLHVPMVRQDTAGKSLKKWWIQYGIEYGIEFTNGIKWDECCRMGIIDGISGI